MNVNLMYKNRNKNEKEIYKYKKKMQLSLFNQTLKKKLMSTPISEIVSISLFVSRDNPQCKLLFKQSEYVIWSPGDVIAKEKFT